MRLLLLTAKRLAILGLAVLRLAVLWLLARWPMLAALVAAPIAIMCMSTAHGD
jgi:hypothetical protein